MRLDRLPGARQVPALLQSVRDDVILFESWHGGYSDSPRAISEALHARQAGLEHVWAVERATVAVPEWVTPVELGSRRYLAALGSARYVVTNISMPAYFRKKSETTYVQTWHGTPLKRIAFDIARPLFEGSKRYLANLRRDVGKWDVLLSPNRFSTTVFRHAFRYDGEIAETGYPRNDLLVSPSADETRHQVRAELGIADGVRAVLYAPTWRDTKPLAMELDVAWLARELGESTVILLRLHPLVATARGVAKQDGALDVSGYPDIRELYLAADVLVTDYSSAMFDFAVTRRPMLFYTYDVDEYRDEVRGFYFDFEQDAPGPLLSTSAAVCDALQDLEAITRRYADAYQRFVERFCYLDDGSATDRVLEAVFDR